MLKLIGLDYVIQYKKGKENLTMDALSRWDFGEGSMQAMIVIVSTWSSEIVDSYKGDQ